MPGTILENLSNRKLSVVIGIIFVIQLISFFIGAFIAPAPSSSDQIRAIKCIPDNLKELSIPRYRFSPSIQPKNCRPTQATFTNGSVVFAFQIPLPKGGIELDYSRWMMNLLAIMMPEVEYESMMANKKTGPDHINGTLVMRIRLAVKENDGEWIEYARKDNLQRTISCIIPENKKVDGHHYDCDMIHMFELQSLYYDYYLINVEFLGGLDSEQHAGVLTDLNMVAIHQNGGFTKIWVALKSVFFVITLMTLVWYWRRLSLLARDKTLIEKMLCVLGIAITQLNLPLELLSLRFDLPFNNFFGDFRQGLLYSALLSFWIIFTGEHLLDGIHRSRLSSYYKQLSVVLVASTALFVFDSIERGVQAFEPFFTIWEVDSHLAMLFLILAGLASSVYFGFLSWQIWLVLRTISSKQTTLPSMSSTRRLIYQGIIYRFKFLLLGTLVCAATTIIAYILGQVSEDPMQWDDDLFGHGIHLEWTSAMFTTVYAMWNCYIITLLILYAPSHKGIGPNDGLDGLSEEIEFNRLTDDKADENFGSTENTELSKLSKSNSEVTSDMKLLQDLATKESFD
ncbi:Protein wntless [Halotydeus destructor]|nr:Protein wntless [Halotydeus destructor]